MDEPTKLSPKLLAGLLKLLKSQSGGADPQPEALLGALKPEQQAAAKQQAARQAAAKQRAAKNVSRQTARVENVRPQPGDTPWYHPRRFWELLRGGNEQTLAGYRKAIDQANKMVEKGIAMKNNALYDKGQALLGDLQHSRWHGGSVTRSYTGPRGRKMYQNSGQIANKGVRRELNRVLAARIGTGAVGLGGAGMLLSGGGNEYEDPYYY